MSSSDNDQENNLNTHKRNNQQGILSIMEAIDKQSKLDEHDTGDDYTQDSISDKFTSQTEEQKLNKKYQKKVIVDTNAHNLKQEFEELLRKQDQQSIKSQNEAELKKLLNDVKCYRNDRKAKLEAQYQQFQKIIDDELLNNSIKPTIKQFNLKTISYPQIIDNRNQFKVDVTQWASTEENINILQDYISQFEEQFAEIDKKIMFEQEKTTSLTKMSKEIKKSTNMAQEQINNHTHIIQSYDKQLKQQEAKRGKYDNSGSKSLVEINKYNRYIKADLVQKQSIITDKNKSIDEHKIELKESINEYKKFQNELEMAKLENDKKIEEIKDVNKKLKQKYQLMAESKKLMKDLDNFDLLTNIFIYGDPQKTDFVKIKEDLANQSRNQRRRSQSDIQKLNNGSSPKDNSATQSPKYKQGSIFNRLKNFYKLHGEDLNVIVGQILQLYSSYNMQNHTLQRRLDDLQSQKNNLSKQWKLLLKEDDNVDKDQIFDNDEEEEINNRELSSPLRPRSNSEIIQQKLSKNRISQQDINELTQFIAYGFLFLNETLFRLVGITSIIKSIVNSSEYIKNDSVFQDQIFKNDLFENLVSIMNFSVSNKTIIFQNGKQKILPSTNAESTAQQSKKQEDATTNINTNISESEQNFQNINSNLSISLKLLELKKRFIEIFPQLNSKVEQYVEIVKNDFILLNFVSLESFFKFYEDFKNKIESHNNTHSNEEIWKVLQEKLITNLMEEGRLNFFKTLNKLLNHLKQMLQRLKVQKETLHAKVLSQNPESPLFKPSHLRRKIEDKKRKQKDWKEKLVKNKIKEYESYHGIHFESEYTEDGVVQSMAEVASQKSQKHDSEAEDDYIEKIWKNEKDNFSLRKKEYLEKKVKKQEEPKVISRYLEQSKYGLQYTESWKYLVKNIKEFGQLIWDKESKEFRESKILKAREPLITEYSSTKPELQFSHVMYKQKNPNLESKYITNIENTSRIRLSHTMVKDDTLKPLRHKSNPRNLNNTEGNSSSNLAQLRKISNLPIRSSNEKLSDSQRERSKSNIATIQNNNNVQISQSRLLNARDNQQIYINTEGEKNNHQKKPVIETKMQPHSIKLNSQMY